MTYGFQNQILSHEDIVVLTRKQRPTAQARYLTHLGIDHRFRPDGTLLVLSDCVRRAMGLDDSQKSTRKKPAVKTDGLLGVRKNRRAA